MDKIGVYKLALEEMRLSYKQYSNTRNLLDQKTNQLLRTTNVLVGLFGLLQLTLLSENQPTLYWIGLIIVTCMYIVLVILCTNSLGPKEYIIPTKADWNMLSERILSVEEEKAFSNVIINYVKYIPHNRKLNYQKTRFLQISYYLFSLIIIILILLSILPR